MTNHIIKDKNLIQPLLHVTNLTTQIGTDEKLLRVVDHIDFTLYPSETFALLGESGCGKSMTALSLMRLLPPSGRIVAGNVWFGDNGDLLDLPERDMRCIRGGRMAMIFQEPQTSLNPVMSVGRQIAEAVELHANQGTKANAHQVIELLQAVGIPDPERRVGEYPHQLSGGMKQRIMIAMALAGHPQLLIADEPTTALDVTIQAQVLRLLKGLQQKMGMAVLLITHDLGVVAETADRLAVMYAGQIVETATAKQFFHSPQHPYSRKLFAALPGANKRGQRLAMIPGMVPPLNQIFSGCRFVERCDAAMPMCRDQPPPWVKTEAAEQQGVRCHLHATNNPAVVTTTNLSKPVTADFVTNTDNLLEVQNLYVHFPIQRGLLQRIVGYVKAVDGVSLQLQAGRTLALVGESGCGKTTVGKGILQLLRPTGGTVRFAGRELTILSNSQLRPLRRALQIIFQDPFASMNPRMLVGDIVAEGLVAQGVGGNRKARYAKVADLLEQVGMARNAVERYPHEFSGGQRQRICIARALAVEPRLIVCDEPTSALDVSVQAQILNLLKDLQNNLGLAYLFITHNISVVAFLAHEVAVMYLGRIVERGTTQEVLEQPQHPYTKALLSAVPTIDDAGRQIAVRLEGDLPSPANPPSGCHFHPRCPEAIAECRLRYPTVVNISTTHAACCWRVVH